MSIAIIAFTASGYALGEKLKAHLSPSGREVLLYRCRTGKLDDWVGEHFPSAQGLVFIGAAGIAVRGIAPYVNSKTSDPAVVVIDEMGRFVIPLLSGHMGGGNRLAGEIADILGAIPVITTATDCNGLFSIDAWAGEHKIRIINPERIKEVSMGLLEGKSIRLRSLFPVEGKLPEGFIDDKEEYDVILTIYTGGGEKALRLVPPVLTLGLGCKKDVPFQVIEEAFHRLLKEAGCYEEAVCRVCSIDMKAGEAGILDFCEAHSLPFQTFSVVQLKKVRGDFTPSPFVEKVTGVDNVCERSAVLGSGGELLVKKHGGSGVAMALGLAPYRIKFSEEA